MCGIAVVVKYKKDFTDQQKEQLREYLFENDQQLCKFCPLPKEVQGVHCYGDQPVMCEGRCCPQALDRYLEEYEEDAVEILKAISSK